MGAASLCGTRKDAVQSLSPRVAPVGSGADEIRSRPGGNLKPDQLRGRKVVWENQNGISRAHVEGSRNSASRSSFRTQTHDITGNTVSLSIGGQVLKKYDVKALIGRGSFSQVLRVENRTTSELFALKIIDKKAADDNRYKVELRVLGRVKHPNIVSLHEVFHSNSKVYAVLELATGGDLFDRIKTRGYCREKHGKTIVRMVLSGVDYLHSVGITHRDLKLENLLYKHPGDDSRILISDFGLAHIKGCSNGASAEVFGEDGMSTTCGTAEYLAPEILEGEIYTNLVDMWAIGVITYIILCGAMPFVDENRARLYRKIRHGQYSFLSEPWSEVSAAGREFIDKLLSVDSSQRLTASEALQHHWLA